MRMTGTGIHKKLLVHLATQAVLRKHPFNGTLDDHLGTALQQVLGNFFFQTTGVTRKVVIHFLLQLVTSELNLVGIDHDNKIATVNVGSEIRFVLTTKDGRDFGAHATYGLIGTINNVPVTLHGSLVRMLGGEMQFAHLT